MSRQSFHDDRSIEARLDVLIDDLHAGREVPSGGDATLRSLSVLARIIRDDEAIEWPDAGFPSRLARDLYAELKPNQTAQSTTVSSFDGAPEGHEETASSTAMVQSTIPALPTEELTGDTGDRFDLRRFAQIAAAIAGFAIVTVVLVAVFRGFDDDAPAVGMGEQRPAQLAVTMLSGQPGSDADIYLVTLDDSEPVNLSDHLANDTTPVWSPDGDRIAFISDRGGSQDLYLMDADGETHGGSTCRPSKRSL